MRTKRILSIFIVFSMILSLFPQIVFAEEYVSIKALADANGYEYFWYEDKATVNVRSASYILSFQNNNNIVAYKTVLTDVGTITLNYDVKQESNGLYVSKLDAQTKLIKYFPNTPNESIEKDSGTSPVAVPQRPASTQSVSSNSGNSPSSWAVSEINAAKNNGLVTTNVMKNYKADISREYFCELVVRLYEKITGKNPTAGTNPFDDTDNKEVIKAYKLGIVNGVSDNEFMPDNSISRQEICAMLVRAIGAMYTNIDLNDYTYHNFIDRSSISSWAMDSVQFAYDNGIIQGVNAANTEINPLGHATCEQAILLVNRIYENRSAFAKKDKSSEAVIETLKTLNFDDDSEVKSVSVSFADGSDASDVKIKEIKDSDLINTTTGIKGSAVSITSKKDFDKATISFEYNPEGLGGSNPSDLAVAWYNTDLDRIEVLESKVNSSAHTVSVETTHFSEYLLIDSKEWYSVWQRGQTIVRETDNNGNNLQNFNVQLVVDCSGSMGGDRINNARQCTYDFINNLADEDIFSVIKFADRASEVIPAIEKGSANMYDVETKVMSMNDGGGTNFNNALQMCINTINTSNGYNNIVVFLSDGGSSIDDSLLIQLSNMGVQIASVALGTGSNTSMMQKLSDATNGQYVYAESSDDLDVIYSSIQGSLIGVDATDTDGDGLPDIIETTGMKNQYGVVIRTDPNKWDTDGDGKSDAEEMGKLIENQEPTETDKKRGIITCTYFEMISDPVEGHVVSNSTKASVELKLLRITSGLNGNFELIFDLNVENCDAKNVYFEWITDDCIEYDMSQAVKAFGGSDYDGRAFFKSIKKGKYSNIPLKIYCKKLADRENREECNINHTVTMKVYGDNLDEQTQTISEVSFYDMKNTATEFNGLANKYIHELKALGTGNSDSNEDAKKVKQAKQDAMDIIEKIPFETPYQIKTDEEKKAITECFYSAVFDYYLAEALKSKNDSKYFDTITATDFADGGFSAAGKIVEGSATLINDVLKNKTFSNTYKSGKYTYDVTLEFPGFMSGTYLKVTFVNTQNSRRYTYDGITNQISQLKDAEAAMYNYMNELYELYIKANTGAMLEVGKEINKILSDVTFSALGVEKISISKKINKKLEEFGLGDVNEFIGLCIDVNKLCTNGSNLITSLTEEDAFAAYQNIKKIYKDMDNAMGSAPSDSSGGTGSTALINHFQQQVKNKLGDLMVQCSKYCNAP